MALKDWKVIRKSGTRLGSGVEVFQNGDMRLRLYTGKDDTKKYTNFGTGNSVGLYEAGCISDYFYERFKTKKAAIRYAEAYMRKH